MAAQRRFCTKLCDINSQQDVCGQGSACTPAGADKAVCAPLNDLPEVMEPVVNGCSIGAPTDEPTGGLFLLLGLALCALQLRRTRD